MSDINWGLGKVLRWLRLNRGLDGLAYAKAMGLPIELETTARWSEAPRTTANLAVRRLMV